MNMKNKEILINENHFFVFTKSMSEVYFNESIECVRKADTSVDEMKNITVDIMKKVSEKKDPDLMNSVATTVQIWKKDKSKAWKSAIIKFAKERPDIRSVNVVTTYDDMWEVVIVVEDTTKENVLDYNDFLFEVREKYNSMKDFMVIDENMKTALDSMYKRIEIIYKRS